MSDSQSKGTIMILAGGTGGHVYPALAVADEFIKQGFKIIWIGTRQGIEARLVTEHGLAIDWLNISGLRGNGLKRLFFAPLVLLRALFQMFLLFNKHKPVLALGMGGFVAGPGGVVAKLMGCPLVIHEQNSIPGVTNKILARMANRVLTGFPNVFTQYTKTQYVGNPVRQSIKAVKQNDDSQVVNLLVFGGSLGARAINQVIPDVLANLQAQGVQVSCQHQTGKLDIDTVKQSYQNLNMAENEQLQVLPYIDDMDNALAKANIAICRAGAMTIAELAMAGLPAVFIPYPFAVDDHQTTNALDSVDADAGILIPQSELSVAKLTDVLVALCNNPLRIKSMAKNALSKAKPQATQDIVSLSLQELSHG